MQPWRKRVDEMLSNESKIRIRYVVEGAPPAAPKVAVQALIDSARLTDKLYGVKPHREALVREIETNREEAERFIADIIQKARHPCT